MEKLKIEYVDINSIKPYEKNPRFNEEAVDYVAKSIKEFGFKNPIIIDENNIIIAGHTRLKASQKLGLKEVPIIKVNDLTDEQIKAFRLADNKVSEKAMWNYELLDEELSNILNINMEDFGFLNVETDNIDFDNLDDDREKEKVNVSIVFDTYEEYENIKKELDELIANTNANLSIKMI